MKENINTNFLARFALLFPKYIKHQTSQYQIPFQNSSKLMTKPNANSYPNKQIKKNLKFLQELFSTATTTRKKRKSNNKAPTQK
ncbi:MAG: hypothetical protein ACTSRA_13790 [Promethearchaeota archaeon]